ALWIIQQSAISTSHTAPLPAKSNPESCDFCPSFIAKPFIIAAQPYLLHKNLPHLAIGYLQPVSAPLAPAVTGNDALP
ncbi:MAG: hypothetical protein SOV95_06425, partial [Anaerovibrio sp.]|uniref:hypothetical protein n=1 Tax=Anaerovibrio sp. TaxID=1872532 RepID=UPI00262E7A53